MKRLIWLVIVLLALSATVAHAEGLFSIGLQQAFYVSLQRDSGTSADKEIRLPDQQNAAFLQVLDLAARDIRIEAARNLDFSSDPGYILRVHYYEDEPMDVFRFVRVEGTYYLYRFMDAANTTCMLGDAHIYPAVNQMGLNLMGLVAEYLYHDELLWSQNLGEATSVLLTVKLSSADIRQKRLEGEDMRTFLAVMQDSLIHNDPACSVEEHTFVGDENYTIEIAYRQGPPDRLVVTETGRGLYRYIGPPAVYVCDFDPQQTLRTKIREWVIGDVPDAMPAQ